MNIQCDNCEGDIFYIVLKDGFLFSVCAHCGDEVNLRQLQNTLDMVE